MELIDVLNNFDIKPHKIEYYEEAFTHSSYANEVKNGVVDSVTVNENPLPIEQIEW